MIITDLFLPSLSLRLPKNAPPSGLTTMATAYVAKVASKLNF
ncbi:MAG: hypothetical protein ACYDAJ_08730 [Nitrosotalea sp.]